jgi:hypothetical protein
VLMLTVTSVRQWHVKMRRATSAASFDHLVGEQQERLGDS